MSGHDDQLEALQHRVAELEALVRRLGARPTGQQIERETTIATEDEAVGRRHLLGSFGRVAAGALAGGTVLSVATASPAAAAAVPVEGDATASLPGVSGRTSIAAGTPQAGVDASSTNAFSPALRATSSAGTAIDAKSSTGAFGKAAVVATYEGTNNTIPAGQFNGKLGAAIRADNKSASFTIIAGNNATDGDPFAFAGGVLFASSSGDTVAVQSSAVRDGAAAVRADGFAKAHGVIATASEQGMGGRLSGGRCDALLGAETILAKAPAQRRHDNGHDQGELAFDAGTGELWMCVIAAPAGQVGTWRKISGPTTAGAFHPIAPTRVYDSRFDAKGKLSPAEGTRVTNVKDGIDLGTGTVSAPNVVPAGATAIAYNLTISETQDAGFLAVYPASEATFKASSINWDRTGQLLANAAIVPISSAQQVKVSVGGGGQTHYLIDVTGYSL